MHCCGDSSKFGIIEVSWNCFIVSKLYLYGRQFCVADICVLTGLLKQFRSPKGHSNVFLIINLSTNVQKSMPQKGKGISFPILLKSSMGVNQAGSVVHDLFSLFFPDNQPTQPTNPTNQSNQPQPANPTNPTSQPNQPNQPTRFAHPKTSVLAVNLIRQPRLPGIDNAPRTWTIQTMVPMEFLTFMFVKGCCLFLNFVCSRFFLTCFLLDRILDPSCFCFYNVTRLPLLPCMFWWNVSGERSWFRLQLLGGSGTRLVCSSILPSIGVGKRCHVSVATI